MNVDGQDLKKFNENLYHQLVRYPLEVIPIFDIVIAEIAMQRVPDWSRHIQVRLGLCSRPVALSRRREWQPRAGTSRFHGLLCHS